MNAVTLDRLIGNGPLLSVSCRFETYEDEDMRRAVAEGEWQAWGKCHDGEWWLASGEEAEIRSFVAEAAVYLGLPRRTV